MSCHKYPGKYFITVNYDVCFLKFYFKVKPYATDPQLIHKVVSVK